LLGDGGEGLWRREPHTKRNANLYPTHGLGPIANMMDINRGDRFEMLVSVSSREAALTEFRDANLKPGDPKRKEKYVCGDMNTSLLRTSLGRTIMLQHDVVTPRPYTRHNMIQGSKGTFADYPARICVDGQPEGESWASIDRWKSHEDPLWSKNGDMARKLGGHGGMDYIMNFRLIECMREGQAPEMDVYDAAAWSAPFPLSELSVAKGSAPIKFPDFTRGNWERKR
ncbi:MAG: gfo/Idh/MocA family oxidoreductase, partial [Armatimonadota bacterium]